MVELIRILEQTQFGCWENNAMNENYTENLLLGICEKLQLSPSLYEQANERYLTIAKTIQNDTAFQYIPLSIYPQGSFRLKTTVKPYNDEEYDLDFVAEISSKSSMTPKQLYDHIYRILKNDGTHNEMVEQKSRCIRVNYANDFHLDIMPGKLINESTHEIIVPDKELQNWYHHSNPIGFANWFEHQARTRILLEMSAMQRSDFDVQKVSEQEIASKLEPLRRAVQLVKRYRDIYCDKNGTEPVRSIVICTLMGQVSSYSGDTLKIIQNFCDYVNKLIANNPIIPFDVKNPVVDEILTEKWHEGNNYQDFVAMMKSLTEDVINLRSYSYNSDANALIKKMFGESITNLVIKDYAKRLTESRNKGEISINSNGIISTNSLGIPIKKNTFYGDKK